ncbi:MAG: Asp-tRNA(Asn)/Glu-tRNA(Gln) amidotransferase subunit GatA [Candidatus Rokuibacteriota bacterium]|nr:MAG: Asp-tRNA(Asn)/Glu-tRNA(Gln) amidotransferase subunit GatA [Candidatus Rokubacteria bacterium]
MAPSLEWPWRSLADAAAAVKAGAVSPVELTRVCLERIERVDHALHAFVSVDAERALQDARRAEREIQAGRSRGPLHGIPVGLKDNYDTLGVATRNGSRVFADRMPTEDATVWARLQEAGAVLLGKTTMSEAAWGVDFPPVRNPWDVRRNPGLSSGGSGAAVAAGLCFMAMGSDTGGSIRIPAGLSGVVGLKATYGRVSRAGVMPHTWSLDHAGPLSRRVEDAALVLGLIAGHDPRDSASASVPVGDYLADLKKGVRGMRIGVPREHFWDRIEGRVATVVRQALHDLEAAGAKLTEVSIPHMPTALGAILVTEMASVTAWHDKYLKQPERRAKYTPEVRALMDAGKLIFATDFLKAQRLRRALTDQVRAAFDGVDVLATPTLPLCAWDVSESHVQIDGQPEHVLHACWRFTYPWNLTGLPALSVPCGFVAELPVGLQLVGRPFDEATILRAGHAYQEATRWHERRPPDPVGRAG